ncbi:MAG: Hint domain-containing protein [Celeribacter sp.]|jgi:hypothetical protein
MSTSSHSDQPASPPAAPRDWICHVLRGADFRVVAGVNAGDALEPTEDMCPGDVYRLSDDGPAWRLAVREAGEGATRSGPATLSTEAARRVAPGSEIGAPGDRVVLEARLTLMAPDGGRAQMVLIAVVAADEGARDLRCALPLDPIEPGADYTLIGIDTDPGIVQLADVTSIAFGRGTAITLADGRQVPIERLEPGMRVLTHNHGAQPLRWVARRTVRAVGASAPVVIGRGVLGNSADLVVSQHQRLFIYQRGADRIGRSADILVKAQYLVDGGRVFIRKGGFCDWFTPVFDRHEVIYAEGIPAESLEVNDATRPGLPEEIAEQVAEQLPRLSHTTHPGTEPDAEELSRAGPDRFHRPGSGGDGQG